MPNPAQIVPYLSSLYTVFHSVIYNSVGFVLFMCRELMSVCWGELVTSAVHVWRLVFSTEHIRFLNKINFFIEIKL